MNVEKDIKEIQQLSVRRRQTYFPRENPLETVGIDPLGTTLANEAKKRAGENLVYAIAYGSQVTGDPSPTSMYDMILIVEDTREFHQQNMQMHPDDYGHPRSAGFHDWLNQGGFNFYRTTVPTDDGRDMHVKYAVISRENFIKGCNGSLKEKERDGSGAFGLYVAGRMQKVALRPLFKDGDERVAQIEEAINTARIDGVFLALGLLGNNFTMDDLITKYVSLSYLADVRIEKPDKIQTLVEKNRQDYTDMLDPIIEEFIRVGLIGRDGESFEKYSLLSEEDVKQRLKKMRVQTLIRNAGVNLITGGIKSGLEYELQKIRRTRRGR